jgi:hypothetical protein
LKIVTDKVTEDLQSFFLTATTKGGKSARKELLISEESCSITIEAKPDTDGIIVLQYEEG